jgi:hypothetical protein
MLCMQIFRLHKREMVGYIGGSKRLGNWKNKTTQGLSNTNLLSFPKHDSLKNWRLKSNVNSHILIQYVNQSESLSWSFSDLSGDNVRVFKENTCADNMPTLDCRKFHKQLLFQKQLNSFSQISFCNVFGQGLVFIF